MLTGMHAESPDRFVCRSGTKTLVCIRPSTPNVGNDLIHLALGELLRSTFRSEVSLVDIPALPVNGVGGLTASQIYDLNRFADGVIVGGGNLFENGQIQIDSVALAGLRVPLMLLGLSHGRVYDDRGHLVSRTDELPMPQIRQLVDRATCALVRDHASERILAEASVSVQVGGCPSLYLVPNTSDQVCDGRVLLSIRHPDRMSIPPTLQWRVAEDVRGIIAELANRFGKCIYLLCHDYKDLSFAAAFPDVPKLYYSDGISYAEALRRCRLNVGYRLHAFLPCLAFGVPAIHISYDQRGKSMLETIGMSGWDLNLLQSTDIASAVGKRIDDLDRFHALRSGAMVIVNNLRAVTEAAIRMFEDVVFKTARP